MKTAHRTARKYGAFLKFAAMRVVEAILTALIDLD